MKVGIYSPYLETLGGGERYILTVAEYFLKKKDHVDLFVGDSFSIEDAEKRFSLNLKGITLAPNIFSTKVSLLKRMRVTRNYDLIFILSDGSIPITLAKRNILHFQTPFNSNYRNIVNWAKLQQFDHIVCNSNFTKKFIDSSYGVESEVLYPPIDIKGLESGRKENIILSVGRFFSPSHSKNQELMIEVFKKLVTDKLRGWQLVLIGGVTDGKGEEMENLRSSTQGAPIKIIENGEFEVLKNYYTRAKIYWHASGYGEDLLKNPDRAEHFGMTTVEAMCSGAVPVVFNGGGLRETVVENESGFFWDTPAQLASKTMLLVKDPNLISSMSSKAIKRADFFSKDKFFSNLDRIT